MVAFLCGGASPWCFGRGQVLDSIVLVVDEVHVSIDSVLVEKVVLFRGWREVDVEFGDLDEAVDESEECWPLVRSRGTKSWFTEILHLFTKMSLCFFLCQFFINRRKINIVKSYFWVVLLGLELCVWQRLHEGVYFRRVLWWLRGVWVFGEWRLWRINVGQKKGVCRRRSWRLGYSLMQRWAGLKVGLGYGCWVMGIWLELISMG